MQTKHTPCFVSITFTQRTDAEMTDVAYYSDNSNDLLILLWGGVNNVITTHVGEELKERMGLGRECLSCIARNVSLPLALEYVNALIADDVT
jgi:hypothetical protein